MKRINIRCAIVSALFIVFGVFCTLYGYGYGTSESRTKGENRLEHFPLKLQHWEGERQLLEEQIYRILDTDAVLVNRYTNGNESVYFSVVYYPEAKVEFHPPEACNTSRGDAVVNLGTREIRADLQKISTTVRVNVFSVIRANGDRDLYYYFFKTGELVGDSYLKLRIRMAMNHLFAKNRGGAMLVLSTPIGKGIDDSMRLLDRFLLDIHPEIIRYI